MTCNEVRQLLELSFGQDDLPQELTAHLQGCPSCRAYREELNQLGDQLGSDDAGVFSQTELDCAIRKVEKEIAPSRTTVVTPFQWLRPVVGVAAAVVVVAISFGTYNLGRYTRTAESSLSEATAEEDYGSITALWENVLDEELDDGLVSVLIDDYSADGYFQTGEALLGDISEEELEYLMENLEVGELL